MIGIDVSQLKTGTTILLATTSYAYEIVVEKKGCLIIVGGDFREPTLVRLIGSFNDDKTGKLDWIGKDMRIMFIAPKGKSVQTTPVVSAKLIGPNKEWELEVWDESASATNE